MTASWIERLRIIGLDRQRQRDASAMMPPPPPLNDEYNGPGTKRRRAAITQDGEDDDAMASGVEGLAGGANGHGTGDESTTRRRKGPRSRESTVMA